MKKFFVAVCLCMPAIFTSQVNADIVQATTTNGAGTPAVSATDLLTGLVSGTDYIWAGAPLQINDGVHADPFNSNGDNAVIGGLQSANVTGGGTYTFSLDTSTNTLGYDISSVDVFSSWNDGRAGHDFDLLFSTDDGASFTSVIAAVAAPGSGEYVSTTIDNDEGFLLGTGVTDVQFVVRAGGVVGNGTVYREIDVNGIATVAVAVPEPSAMFVLAGFGLVLLRRRK